MNQKLLLSATIFCICLASTIGLTVYHQDQEITLDNCEHKITNEISLTGVDCLKLYK